MFYLSARSRRNCRKAEALAVPTDVAEWEQVQALARRAALVFRRGRCTIVPAGPAGTPGAGLLIARRRDIAKALPDDVSDEQLDALARRLDSTVRELGG